MSELDSLRSTLTVFVNTMRCNISMMMSELEKKNIKRRGGYCCGRDAYRALFLLVGQISWVSAA